MNAVANQRETGRQNGLAEESFLSPEVNIFETKEGYVLEAEMAGVNKEGLELTLEGNVLTIVGRRDSELPKAAVLYRESQPSHFRRVFELDPTIDAAKISARVEQGILTLSLPKTESVKPRRISISN